MVGTTSKNGCDGTQTAEPRMCWLEVWRIAWIRCRVSRGRHMYALFECLCYTALRNRINARSARDSAITASAALGEGRARPPPLPPPRATVTRVDDVYIPTKTKPERHATRREGRSQELCQRSIPVQGARLFTVGHR